MVFDIIGCFSGCIEQTSILTFLGLTLLGSFALYKSKGLFKNYTLKVGAIYSSILLTSFPILYVMMGMGCTIGLSLCSIMNLIGYSLPFLAISATILFYFFGSKIFLFAISAKRIKREDAPLFYDSCLAISQKNNMKMPSLHYIDSAELQAFSVCGNSNHVVLSVGLIEDVDKQEEAEIIMGHELQHLKRMDPFMKATAIILSIFSPTGVLNSKAIHALVQEQEKD